MNYSDYTKSGWTIRIPDIASSIVLLQVEASVFILMLDVSSRLLISVLVHKVSLCYLSILSLAFPCLCNLILRARVGSWLCFILTRCSTRCIFCLLMISVHDIIPILFLMSQCRSLSNLIGVTVILRHFMSHIISLLTFSRVRLSENKSVTGNKVLVEKSPLSFLLYLPYWS